MVLKTFVIECGMKGWQSSCLATIKKTTTGWIMNGYHHTEGSYKGLFSNNSTFDLPYRTADKLPSNFNASILSKNVIADDTVAHTPICNQTIRKTVMHRGLIELIHTAIKKAPAA